MSLHSCIIVYGVAKLSVVVTLLWQIISVSVCVSVSACGIVYGIVCGFVCGIVCGIVCNIVCGTICGIVCGFVCGIVRGIVCSIVSGIVCGIVCIKLKREYVPRPRNHSRYCSSHYQVIITKGHYIGTSPQKYSPNIYSTNGSFFHL